MFTRNGHYYTLTSPSFEALTHALLDVVSRADSPSSLTYMVRPTHTVHTGLREYSKPLSGTVITGDVPSLLTLLSNDTFTYSFFPLEYTTYTVLEGPLVHAHISGTAITEGGVFGHLQHPSLLQEIKARSALISSGIHQYLAPIHELVISHGTRRAPTEALARALLAQELREQLLSPIIAQHSPINTPFRAYEALTSRLIQELTYHDHEALTSMHYLSKIHPEDRIAFVTNIHNDISRLILSPYIREEHNNPFVVNDADYMRAQDPDSSDNSQYSDTVEIQTDTVTDAACESYEDPLPDDQANAQASGTQVEIQHDSPHEDHANYTEKYTTTTTPVEIAVEQEIILEVVPTKTEVVYNDLVTHNTLPTPGEQSSSSRKDTVARKAGSLDAFYYKSSQGKSRNDPTVHTTSKNKRELPLNKHIAIKEKHSFSHDPITIASFEIPLGPMLPPSYTANSISALDSQDESLIVYGPARF